MKKHRMARRLVGLTVAATISVGVASPVGFAQEADYGEAPNPGLPSAGGTLGGTSGDASAQLKQCIKKAKKKFSKNAAKKKLAIKKCKKKFGS